jgi:Zn-finger nucleic acid-binding protein
MNRPYGVRRIIRVIQPARWIVDDVLADAVQVVMWTSGLHGAMVRCILWPGEAAYRIMHEPPSSRRKRADALSASHQKKYRPDIMKRSDAHKWQFKGRFRRHAFGWRSQPAIQRIKEAVSEIKDVASMNPVLAADGAVAFIERISPALVNVDSSSGAIGAAVNCALHDLTAIIAHVEVDTKTREAWLERLWEAHEADQMPYIERLADDWGELCGSKQLAAVWSDRLMGITRAALSPDPEMRGHFHGTSACLSVLYRAERYGDIVELVSGDRVIWPYKRWAVMALAAAGNRPAAIEYAESCRGPWADDGDIDRLCEEMLLSSGLIDEAYERYGLRANRHGTYLATFRAVAKKYPHKKPGEILADLVNSTPGEEGKWFAAAKDAGLYDEALALASRSPCDPKTLTRAARDFAQRQPAFATQAGYLALF